MKTPAQEIFRAAGIRQIDIAAASGRTPAMVCRVMKGINRSRFVEADAMQLLQEKLGHECPTREEVFGNGRR